MVKVKTRRGAVNGSRLQETPPYAQREGEPKTTGATVQENSMGWILLREVTLSPYRQAITLVIKQRIGWQDLAVVLRVTNFHFYASGYGC